MFGQALYRGRFEWGPSGADAIAPGAAFVAVVDVLSFTTALSVAVENGIAVMPYPWRDGTAVEVAKRYDAELAVGRSVAGPDEISLSPAVIRRVAAGRAIERLVLPSPNGSAISARLAAARGPGLAVAAESFDVARTPIAEKQSDVQARSSPAEQGSAAEKLAADWPGAVGSGAGGRLGGVEVWPDAVGSAAGEREVEAPTVIGVSLRNAAAAGEWVRERLAGRVVAVVAAGERWPDGALRPAVEDLWGAGAFLDGFSDLSPEAEVAVAAYRSVAGRIPEVLAAASSGRELIAAGFGGDVDVAAEVGSADVVPVLGDGWFRRAG